jgi:hypothetical protein
LEEIENFKDAEVSFPESKGKEMESSVSDEVEDEASEEHLPRHLERKVAKVIREEQANKEIMMGSQQTLTKMMGNNWKPPKAPWKQHAHKGGSLNPLNNFNSLLELQGLGNDPKVIVVKYLIKVEKPIVICSRRQKCKQRQ